MAYWWVSQNQRHRQEREVNPDFADAIRQSTSRGRCRVFRKGPNSS